MDKLNPWIVGGSLTISLAVVYTVCALAVVLWPQATFAFFSTWFHGLNLSALAPVKDQGLTIVTFIGGLLSLSVTMFIIGALFAGIYNLFVRD